MTCSWGWLRSIFRSEIVPLFRCDVVTMNKVWSFTTIETAECDYTILTIHKCSMLIEWARNLWIVIVFASSLTTFPFECSEIKGVNISVVAIIKASTYQEHLIIIHYRHMVRYVTYKNVVSVKNNCLPGDFPVVSTFVHSIGVWVSGPGEKSASSFKLPILSNSKHQIESNYPSLMSFPP